MMVELETKFEHHFESEEEYMEKIGFPKLNKHKEMHQEILEEYFNLKRELLHHPKGCEETFRVYLKISKFLRDILINHSFGEDHEYYLWQLSKMED